MSQWYYLLVQQTVRPNRDSISLDLEQCIRNEPSMGLELTRLLALRQLYTPDFSIAAQLVKTEIGRCRSLSRAHFPPSM
jgi:hypothetical protein